MTVNGVILCLFALWLIRPTVLYARWWWGYFGRWRRGRVAPRVARRMV